LTILACDSGEGRLPQPGRSVIVWEALPVDRVATLLMQCDEDIGFAGVHKVNSTTLPLLSKCSKIYHCFLVARQAQLLEPNNQTRSTHKVDTAFQS
jgi:hypothetical protein